MARTADPRVTSIFNELVTAKVLRESDLVSYLREAIADGRITEGELVGIRNRCIEAAKILRVIIDWAAAECEEPTAALPAAVVLPPPGVSLALPVGG